MTRAIEGDFLLAVGSRLWFMRFNTPIGTSWRNRRISVVNSSRAGEAVCIAFYSNVHAIFEKDRVGKAFFESPSVLIDAAAAKPLRQENKNLEPSHQCEDGRPAKLYWCTTIISCICGLLYITK